MRRRRKSLFDADKLFDWWSVPHFMFGIVMALAVIAFSWPIFWTFAGTLTLALLWELLEKYVRLSEAPGNGWIDVVLPLFGFVITYLLVDPAALNHDRHVGLLAITTLLYLFINMIAWRARFDKDTDFLG